MNNGITKALLGGKLMFPTEYVAAIEFKGKDVSLTITSVRMEDLKMQGGKKERKPVLCFKETRKKLILNKTNAGAIADIYGTAAEAWVGKRITLYPTRTQCGPRTVDCIRIRDTRPKQDTPAPQFDEPESREDDLMDDDAFNGTETSGDAHDSIPPVPEDAEKLVDAVATMAGIEMEAADKILRPQFSEPWAKMSAEARSAWWIKFVSGSIPGLAPLQPA